MYLKLSELVNEEDNTFTVLKSFGYKWKKWDNESKKMLVSDDYQEGYRKIYALETDKGELGVGPGQLGNLLEPVFKNGEANLIGQKYAVKSNGKSGMEIRYFFNPVRIKEAPKEVDEVFNETEPVDLNDIPF